MSGPIDNALLAQAAAGDEAAFAALIEPHQRSVFRHCYRMLGSGADAEDATQDTLERAWRRLTTYDGSGAFGAWLQRIATNICLDGLRAKRTRIGPAGYGPPMAPGSMPGPPDPELVWVEPVGDSDLCGTGDPQEEVMRREEISLAFVAALQRLAPRQRAALLLHDVLGFTHAEPAEVLGVSAGAVNSLLSRARESVLATAGRPQPNIAEPRVQELLERYARPGSSLTLRFRPGVAEDSASPCRRSPPGSTAERRPPRSSRPPSSAPPARTGSPCDPVGATANPPSPPTSLTARDALPPAACRSFSSPRSRGGP